jgi:hypothetical protein
VPRQRLTVHDLHYLFDQIRKSNKNLTRSTWSTSRSTTAVHDQPKQDQKHDDLRHNLDSKWQKKLHDIGE